ncbi:Uncharacterized protein Fot_10774 [Forsythia ovata]|uniref:Uncharacterized protein n=1 Tax=Forsythia ovata TaxID=205694 RepID=A0ABD1WHU4_9LAMI
MVCIVTCCPATCIRNNMNNFKTIQHNESRGCPSGKFRHSRAEVTVLKLLANIFLNPSDQFTNQATPIYMKPAGLPVLDRLSCYVVNYPIQTGLGQGSVVQVFKPCFTLRKVFAIVRGDDSKRNVVQESHPQEGSTM